MTDPKLNLDNIERVAREATPGPWEAEPFYRYSDGVRRWRIFLRGHANPATNSRDCDWTERDAKHITNCSPDVVLALVARIRELEMLVPTDTERKAMHWYCDGNESFRECGAVMDALKRLALEPES